MQSSPTTQIGRYEVLAQLGRGAMGVVYQARDPQIDRLVAIKTIVWIGDEPDEHAYRQRFLQEAKAAGRLSHPGIVQVFDVGQDSESGSPFIVMEYVAGQSLNKVLSVSPGTKLPLPLALRLTHEIAEALAYAHSQGVVHRDIKPANILVTEDGHAKIADFGVAKLDFSQLTLAGHAVGTPAYMSPEQLAGGEVDGRADLFSLGVILYSMLCGFRPFQGRGNSTIAHKVQHGEPLPVSTLDTHLPAGVDELVARAMAKDPVARFQTGTEMAAAIRALRAAEAPSSTTDVNSVMQETRAHVACMDPNKGAAAKQQPPKPKTPTPGTTPAPATSSTKPPTTSNTATTSWTRTRLFFSSSRRGVAAILSISLVSACVLAWRLHAAMQPQPAPDPVAWESAQNAASAQDAAPAAQDPASAPQDTAAPTDAPATSDAAPTPAPAEVTLREKKVAAKKKDAERNDVTVADRTVKLVSTSASANPKPMAKVAPEAATGDFATVQLALEHGFSEAKLTVWVGDRQVLSETVRGEKKRLLMFQRTKGNYVDKVSIPAGQHLMRVRVESQSDKFDAAQSVNGDFAKASQYVLSARCDKRHNELKLELQPLTTASAGDSR